MTSDYYRWLTAMRGQPELKPEPEKKPTVDAGGDPPHIGRCDGAGGHGPVPVWFVPNDKRWYCAAHLRRILAIAWWKP